MALLPVTVPALAALALIVGGFALALWRRYPISYTMVVLCLGVFLIQMTSPALGRCALQTPQGRIGGDCVVLELGFIAPAFASGEQLLSPFTYMFVHADLLHIAGNLFILLAAGPILESRIGSRNFLALYLIAGLGAAAASLGLWQLGFFHGLQEYSPNIGASGAIFGVLTGFAALYPREKLPMIMPLIPMAFMMPAIAVLGLYLAFNLVYIVSNTGIAWWGHFAGFVVGVAAAPLLPRRKPSRSASQIIRVNAEALQPLAHNNVQRSALRELERLQEPKTPDDRALAQVWWERFLAHAKCPACGDALGQEGLDLRCPRGDYHVLALREASPPG